MDDLLAGLPRGRRSFLGIAGPPGAGKSTLAQEVVERLGDRAVLVPMDGFHLADSALVRLGRADRKGAPDTFDAAGYVALLRRLRDQTDDVVWAPLFRRELELAEAGAIGVDRSVEVVVTEGNYLLCDGPFAQVRSLLDQTWYVDLDDATRRQRLVERHRRHGRSREEAEAWVAATDDPNAALVAVTRDRADYFVNAEGGSTGSVQ